MDRPASAGQLAAGIAQLLAGKLGDEASASKYATSALEPKGLCNVILIVRRLRR
jgi:hypothetical protein